MEQYEIGWLPVNFSHKIGEGVAATVYKYKTKGKFLAVKCFRNPITKKKIQRIAKKSLQIAQENIVQFVGYSLRPSILVFEYCELNIDGEFVHTVSQVLEIWNNDEKYKFLERLDISIQSTKSLKALHDLSIVHKDFKPENLLVSGTSDKIYIKLTDFDDVYGLKTIAKTNQTKLNGFQGFTLAFCDSEICLQRVSELSLKSDIYSWAITIYEIFVGVSTPWIKVLPSTNDVLLLNALAANKRPPLQDISDKYSKNDTDLICANISKSWDPDSNKRPTISKVS